MICVLVATPVVLTAMLLTPALPMLRFASGLGTDFEIAWPSFVAVSIATIVGESLVLLGSLHGRRFLAGFVLLVLWGEALYFQGAPVLLGALLLTTAWAARIQWARGHGRVLAGPLPAFAVSGALTVALEAPPTCQRGSIISSRR